MSRFAPRNFKKNLDMSTPAARDAYLGTWLYEISTDLTTLQTQMNALLSHLDTANVAGIGNANRANFAPTIINTIPENRT